MPPAGVLQLMFKTGSVVATVSDRAYGTDGVDRSFQLYNERRLLGILEGCGCTLVEAGWGENLGGLMYFTDPKPLRHCVFWVRKN